MTSERQLVPPVRARVVVGVGLSSRATRDDVIEIVTKALAAAGRDFPPDAIATRACFVNDPRLDLGVPVVGFGDQELVAHSPPAGHRPGLPARVAQTAAALATGVPLGAVGPTQRSSHATAAVAACPLADPPRHPGTP